MSRPARPTDQLVVNGWYLEIPGLSSPHFETLDGISKGEEDVSIVDGGTNKTFTFGGQVISFGKMTLSRTRQGNADDKALNIMIDAMITKGVKINITGVKLHHGVEQFRIYFQGFRIGRRSKPSWNVNSSEKYTETYEATCDDWDEI